MAASLLSLARLGRLRPPRRSIGVTLYIFLAGVPAFWAKNQNAIFSAVLRGQVDFNGAKDLVKNINPKERLMAFQVLGDEYPVADNNGVGTNLKLAFQTGIHDTIGIDLVAMSVNDIVTSGVKPLFFLHYYATRNLEVDLAEKVIKGIVDGCQQSVCILLGGEVRYSAIMYKFIKL
ncbi:phosphoribosylformylglycinamidine cyclo-ligase, chloroplastic/mitochondrial [Hordeum vulgare]|nr:phosphoribosylformylglycinamidine cyclo-ligase, chloroplastic/mitochondrial [Hordeum vulgare]